MAAKIDNEEAAKRLAKTIMQDISLYNTEKIQEAIKNDSVFETMASELTEGRNHYQNRVAPELLGKTNFFERAINDILIRDAIIKSKGSIETKIS
jgi:hypothetical protein